MASLAHGLGFSLGDDFLETLPVAASFSTGGDDIQLTRRDDDGLYDLQWDTTGNPAFTSNQSHAVLSALLEHRGEWWADQTGQRGSVIHTIKQNLGHTPLDIKAAADQALQPLVDVGIIATVLTGAVKKSPTRVDLQFTWSLNGNSPDYAGLLPFNF